MSRQRLAVALDRGDGLDLRLREVHVEADLVFRGKVPAGDDKFIAAMEGDRRGEGGTNLVPVVGPAM